MSFLRKGNLVSRFKVVSRLDSGKRAWREVYLTTTITDDGEERKCVLVIYDYELTREAGLLPKSNCPYEVDWMMVFDDDLSYDRYCDSGEWVNPKGRRFLYAAYEYVEGVRLDKFMKRKKHPKLGVDFFVDLCEAVNNVAIVTDGGGHNAISPKNIIVKDMGGGKYKPYLIGYADMWGPTKRKKVCDVESLDHRFRAPETFAGAFSEASDIYSLGMIYAYITYGEKFMDCTLEELQEMTEKQRRRVIERNRYGVLWWVDCDEEPLREIVMKAIEEKPEERFYRVWHIKQEIEKLSKELREFDDMCNSLFAKQVEQKESFFDKEKKKEEPSTETSDFDKLLDDFIKTQLEGDEDDNKETIPAAESGSDNSGFEDFIRTIEGTVDEPEDTTPFDYDWRNNDDGSAKVNVSIKKLNGRGFADVAGMHALKSLLKRNFIDIILHKEKAKKYNIKPSNGILLYGPPGCGKTFIAEKIAEEANLSFVMVKPSDLGSTYVHGSQTKIADLFKKAEEKAPALICFDEFDALVPTRKEDTNHNYLTEINEFLVQLNNCASRGIYVLAMTNNINMIDSAVMRKGRIDEVIYVPEPDNEARSEMFRIELKKCDLVSENIDFDKLSDMTRGYTSSDISYIVMEASREAFRSAIEIDGWVEVDQSLLEKIIQRTSPSISEKDIKHYESMRDEFVNKKQQIDIRPRIGFAV